MAVAGEALAEQNRLESATSWAKQGVQLAERSVDMATAGWGHLCLVRVLFSSGDLAGAEAVVRKMEAAAQEANVPGWIRSQASIWQARMWLSQGNLKAASKWARQMGLTGAEDGVTRQAFGFFSMNDHMMLARTMIAREEPDTARRLLLRLSEAAQGGGRISTSIEALSLLALAHQSSGETDQALCALDRALRLGEARGFVRAFADEGPPMARLLNEAASRGIMPGYVSRLLAAFPVGDSGTNSSSGTGPDQSGLIEPVSERELEVLQLISEGLTNREIATQLFLSLNTVKAHTRNIYGKLGVHNRTKAVAEARALGLLGPS
jgi:LuxR family maltose regulon positive regulatory protein